MRIAYIEDNPLDFALLQKALGENHNYDIEHYRYLNEFLNSDHPYDVVVTDLSLPDAYGPEVLCKIRKVTGKPIVVLSGVGGEYPPFRIKQAIANSGATYFSSKHDPALTKLKTIITNLK